METVILVIHLMLVVALIGAVLLQRSEGGGLGMGGGGGMMSSRGTANALTRATAILATGFFITSLVLTYLATIQRKPTSIIAPVQTEQSAPAAPSGPVPPLSGGSVLDQLKGAPSAPPPPPSN